MNFKTIKSLALFAILSFSPARAGIVILAEVPEGIKQLIKRAQYIAQTCVEQKNNENQAVKYLLEISDYAPHFTLAYVSDKELTMDQLQEKEPKLIETLQELANTNRSVDISSGLKESHLVTWKGKYERGYAGKKFKNYAILVIKIKPSAALISLVEKLDKALEKHPTANKREFPFVLHVTLAYVYHERDIDVDLMVEILKSELEKCITEYQMSEDNFCIEVIKLSAHDKNQQVFKLEK